MNTSASTIATTAIKNRALIVTTIMMVAILEVLDSTIVNVALPHMMPSLGANSEEITWVLTAYVIAAAMILPLTGYLADTLGRKTLLIINVSGFMLSSIFCGISNSLSMMVICRLLQGGFGAALIPVSQSMLRSYFSKAEQAKAMAIWGLGIMAAPVFGPTIGGYITEHSSWRWIFYLNAPICALALIMIIGFIPNTERIKQRIDWFGVILMFAGIGCLQLLLDQGNNHDWFNSTFITTMAAISGYCLIYFIYRSWTHRTPAIQLKIFRDRNFAITTLILTIFCGAIFGTLTLEPIMLETLFNYTAVLAGNTLMAVGIGSVIAMSLVPLLLKRLNEKIILSTAALLGVAASLYLASLNLSAAQHNFMIANLLLGAAIGLMMVPLSTYSLLTLAKQDTTAGAGLFSYGRMLGSSIGISLCSTFAYRFSQTAWHSLDANISSMNPRLQLWLQQQQLSSVNHQAIAKLDIELSRQAHMLAFNHIYQAIAISFALLIVLVLFIKHVEMH